ncbi:hypothetical protein CWI39_3301p0010, partial [Hamiltosporidium magnivora]
IHKQPIPPLKQVDNEEDDVKTENTKNILHLILDGITTAKEPTTNTNEEFELEEEIEVVEMGIISVLKEIFKYKGKGALNILQSDRSREFINSGIADFLS